MQIFLEMDMENSLEFFPDLCGEPRHNAYIEKKQDSPSFPTFAFYLCRLSFPRGLQQKE